MKMNDLDVADEDLIRNAAALVFGPRAEEFLKNGWNSLENNGDAFVLMIHQYLSLETANNSVTVTTPHGVNLVLESNPEQDQPFNEFTYMVRSAITVAAWMINHVPAQDQEGTIDLGKTLQ